MEPITEDQLKVLQWVAEGYPDDGRWASHAGAKASARALHNRKLIIVDNSYRGWSAEVTDAGTYYLAHGEYPPDHRLHNLDLTPIERKDLNSEEPSVPEIKRKPGRPPKAKREPAPVAQAFGIDSPQRLRLREEQRAHEARERMRNEKNPGYHPWDDRILVSVKEAAWVLSVSENIIRQAVRDGDLHRVYIGEGTTQYRIVYQSLLAWVDSLPRESLRGY